MTLVVGKPASQWIQRWRPCRFWFTS